MKLELFLNPVAGNGQALKAYRKLCNILKNEKIAFNTTVSKKPEQFIQLAKEYGQKEHPINERLIIIGGDGSLNQVLNGIKHSSHSDIPLTYLSAGSGNDFARAAKISNDPQKLVDSLLKQPKIEKVDCGSFTNLNSPKEVTYFVNNLGIGFDAYVVHRSNAAALKKGLNRLHFGNMIYSFNIINALIHQNTFAVTVKNHDKIMRFGDAYFVITTNHPYFGGGIAILPRANIYNHKLDTVIVEKPSLAKFIFLFGKLLKNGSHVTDPQFHYLEAEEIIVHTHKPEFAQLDGEDLPHQDYQLKFKIDSFNLIK